MKNVVIEFENGGQLVLAIAHSYGRNVPAFLDGKVAMTVSSFHEIPIEDVIWKDVARVIVSVPDLVNESNE